MATALSQFARATGALEAEIEIMELEASNADLAYTRAIKGKKVAKLREALTKAEALLNELMEIENIS